MVCSRVMRGVVISEGASDRISGFIRGVGVGFFCQCCGSRQLVLFSRDRRVSIYGVSDRCRVGGVSGVRVLWVLTL